MNKKNILIIFICIIGIICVVLGEVLFLNNNTSSQSNKSDTKQEVESSDDSSSDGEEITVYTSSEEVLKVLEKLNSNATISYVGEVDGCWEYSSSDGNSYSYCLDDPVIRSSVSDTSSSE